MEEPLTLASKKSAAPTERITNLQEDIEDTRSNIEKTQALIPDISSLQSKVNKIDIALTDYKKTSNLFVDAPGSARLLLLRIHL